MLLREACSNEVLVQAFTKGKVAMQSEYELREPSDDDSSDGGSMGGGVPVYSAVKSKLQIARI